MFCPHKKRVIGIEIQFLPQQILIIGQKHLGDVQSRPFQIIVK